MAPAEAAVVRVEVVYCPNADAVDRVELRLPAGATVQQALDASGLLARHPQIDAARLRVGIWGRVTASGQPLADGDRVELYRPLQVDPKQARRLRAARQR